ncbi:MAG: hypothetical protein LH615_07775 [Ferruginibacter sp.]|nr:hypothetical protein [Ferruginibacter sp.]
MKKKIFLSLLVFVTTAGSIIAQQTVEQKPNVHAKETYFKLKTDLSLVGDQEAKVYMVFEDYYTTEMKIKEEMRHAGNTDAERFADNMRRVALLRDTKLKAILTAAQLNKWVTEIEPSMRAPKKAEEQKQ